MIELLSEVDTVLSMLEIETLQQNAANLSPQELKQAYLDLKKKNLDLIIFFLT